MRITTQDVNSLLFATTLIGSVKDQTVAEKPRHNLEIHQNRIRKIYLLLLNCSIDRTFDYEKACQTGIPDNSVVASGIRAVCPKADDSFDETVAKK